MLKEILKNVFTKKKTIPFPDGFDVTPEQAAKIVDFQKKIDTITPFRAVLGVIAAEQRW